MRDFRSPVMAKIISQPALDITDVPEAIGRQGLLLLMPFRIRIHSIPDC
jgi:hypothetical protein